MIGAAAEVLHRWLTNDAVCQTSLFTVETPGANDVESALMVVSLAQRSHIALTSEAADDWRPVLLAAHPATVHGRYARFFDIWRAARQGSHPTASEPTPLSMASAVRSLRQRFPDFPLNHQLPVLLALHAYSLQSTRLLTRAAGGLREDSAEEMARIGKTVIEAAAHSHDRGLEAEIAYLVAQREAALALFLTPPD